MKLYSLQEGLKKGLSRARKESGLTQQQLADSLGLHIKTIMNWEQGKAVPPLKTLDELSQFYGCNLDYLTGRIDCKTHEIQFIHDYSGLSEKAITMLNQWSVSNRWSEYISKIIENDKSNTLFENMSFLMGTAILAAKGTTQNIDRLNVSDLYASHMWNISRIFSNIIEQLFIEELDKHLIQGKEVE